MNKKETVSLHVQLDEKEFVRFALYSRHKSIVVNTISATILLIVYFLTLTELSFMKVTLLSVVSTLVLCLPGLIIAVSLQERKRFRSDYKLREEAFYEVNNMGILRSTNKEGLPIGWEQLKSIKELKSIFILYHSPTKAMIFPKRAFHSKDDILLFKQLSSKQMKKERVHFKKTI